MAIPDRRRVWTNQVQSTCPLTKEALGMKLFSARRRTGSEKKGNKREMGWESIKRDRDVRYVSIGRRESRNLRGRLSFPWG